MLVSLLAVSEGRAFPSTDALADVILHENVSCFCAFGFRDTAQRGRIDALSDRLAALGTKYSLAWAPDPEGSVVTLSQLPLLSAHFSPLTRPDRDQSPASWITQEVPEGSGVVQLSRVALSPSAVLDLYVLDTDASPRELETFHSYVDCTPEIVEATRPPPPPRRGVPPRRKPGTEPAIETRIVCAVGPALAMEELRSRGYSLAVSGELASVLIRPAIRATRAETPLDRRGGALFAQFEL